MTRDVVHALDAIRERIVSAGGSPDEITIVAVTKAFGPDAVADAVRAGLSDIGENYAQELLEKADGAPPGVRWHFLGAIQRNKVGALAPVVHLWHGVDRVTAGEAIAKRRPGASVLVQVNITREPQRNGVLEEDVPALVDALRNIDLDVAGLMTVAAIGGGDTARRQFERVARLREQLGLRELSMGMTDDLEPAVEAGSTMIRIGRALFGARPGTDDVRR